MSKDKVLVRVTKFKDDELAHFGIMGQKWGVRRFQNTDGSLTPLGKSRYGYKGTKNTISDEQLTKTSFNRHKTKSVLNRLDQEAAQQYGDAQRYAEKAKRSSNESRRDKYLSKGKAHLDNAKDIESVEWKLVGKAIERGYDVQMRSVTRASLNTGAQLAGTILAGPIGGAAMLTATAKYIPSTLFDVKRTKDGKGIASHVVKI